MSEDPKVIVQPTDREPSAGSSVKTFVAVALLLGAVVGGAYYISGNSASDQASVTTEDSSATGASSGEAGSSSTTAPPSSTPAPAAPEPTPAEKSAPATQP